MKPKVFFFFVIIMFSNIVFSQNTIKMTNNYGVNNQEVQDLLDFENIYVEQLNFDSNNLIGKSYQIHIEEYIDGKLAMTSMLFDGTETDYFKINSNKESLKFFFKLNNGKLKLFIRGKKFGSKKFYFSLQSDSDDYALKDFFGSKTELKLMLSEKNTVFAIITPTIHEDGSGSYCEVAQADEKPEKLGQKFNIPHYFLITIIFK